MITVFTLNVQCCGGEYQLILNRYSFSQFSFFYWPRWDKSLIYQPHFEHSHKLKLKVGNTKFCTSGKLFEIPRKQNQIWVFGCNMRPGMWSPISKSIALHRALCMSFIYCTFQTRYFWLVFILFSYLFIYLFI